MFQLTFGEYSVYVEDGSLPETYAEYSRHAQLKVEIGREGSEGRPAFCAVARQEGWPFLTIALRYSPAGHGFAPGVLLVPESAVLFYGAGTQLLAFDLHTPRQLWGDVADMGFWSWRRYGSTVLMSAELELAAWDVAGRKLWTTFVEPPWSYTVHHGAVRLDVMGEVSEFSLQEGPRRT